MRLEGTLKGENWREEIIEGAPHSAKITSVAETWALGGSVAGYGEAFYLLAYAADGSVIFRGFDRLHVLDEAHKGTLVLSTTGRFGEHMAQATWRLEPSLCSGAFASYTSGQGGYTAGAEGPVPFSLALTR